MVTSRQKTLVQESFASLAPIAEDAMALFSPQRLEAKFPDLHTLFSGYGLAPIAMQFTIWLGWALLAAGTITAVVASYLRHRALAWVAAMLGVVGVVLTLITLYGISKIGAEIDPRRPLPRCCEHGHTARARIEASVLLVTA